MMKKKKRLVVGISGASGAVLGIMLLKAIKQIPDLESHLVVTGGAEKTILLETDYTLEEVTALADKSYDIGNIGESIASGTFKTIGMVVLPCSMKTLAGVNMGYSDNLLLRAADVSIKEKRKLVLVARETPLSTIHLRNMLSLSQMGVIVMPAMLTYYNKPSSIEDMNNHIIGKILDKFDIELPQFKRWGEAVC
jgi:4-hydroxy-3-polyprenylbenzoate decarboxylase